MDHLFIVNNCINNDNEHFVICKIENCLNDQHICYICKKHICEKCKNFATLNKNLKRKNYTFACLSCFIELPKFK